MSTILDLALDGHVIKLDARLSWREQEERQIFLLPPAVDWMRNVLPNEVSNWNLDISPEEQLDDLAWQFCSGQELIVERQLRLLHHIANGVWELKTADLRIFGWFPYRDCFVCAVADTAQRIKEDRLYGKYRDMTVQLREGLALDEPKFVPGEDYDGILTDWDYPAS